MRRNVIDNVKIVEPPIGELAKGRSGWKRTCATGCGCILFLVIALIVGVRFATGPGPQVMKSVPDYFPADIPIYDADNIDKVTFISGKYKDRGIEIAAVFPKIILSPLFLALNKNTPVEPAITTTTGPVKPTQRESILNLWKIISTPVGDHRDTIQVEWLSMDAEPSFVVAYYKTELRKKKFTIEVESEGQGVRQFSFSREDGLSGSLYVQGDEQKSLRTEYAILTVNLPSKD